jgi:putrescine aminotransferase
MNNLITSEQSEELEYKIVVDYYKKFVNSSYVSLLSSFPFGRELVESSEGAYLTMKNGEKILDMTGGIGVLNHGHNHKKIIEARLRFQNKKKMEVHKAFLSPYVAALSHNLAQLLPNDLNISYFSNSGTEANEGAIKMAYKYHDGNRKTILHSDISFHGKTLGSASITASKEVNYRFPSISKTDSFEYDSIESLVKAIENNTNEDGQCDIFSIIIEPFSASTLRKCSEEFLIFLKDKCNELDIVLIFDEVYSGYFKTGKFFNFMRVDCLSPDILTMAKSFGGGKSSISAFVATDKLFNGSYNSSKYATLHSSTYYGFGEECYTAIEALNIAIDENYSKKAEVFHKVFEEKLKILIDKYPDILSSYSGSGSYFGIFFKKKFTKLESIAKLLPLEIAKTEDLMIKVVVGSVLAAVYEKHNILLFMGLTNDCPLKISASFAHDELLIAKTIDAIDDVLSSGLVSLVSKFVISKFSNY